ncbi:MAG: hypothetical protein Q9160_008818 [Pyrenula sp. 1 TL-2023]
MDDPGAFLDNATHNNEIGLESAASLGCANSDQVHGDQEEKVTTSFPLLDLHDHLLANILDMGDRLLQLSQRPVIPLLLHPGEHLAPVEEIAYVTFSIHGTVSVEWSQLKKLTVASIDDLATYEGRVPELDSLFIHSYSESSISRRDWDLELGPLRKIAWIGQLSTDLPVWFLSAYGQTLEELVIESWEPTDAPRRATDPQQVKALAERCLKIRTLRIDLSPAWVWQ